MSRSRNTIAIVSTIVVSLSSMVIFATILRQASATQRAVLISNENNTFFVQKVIRLSKAADMLAYMNESIDPCSDFYEFSCGNWPRINPSSLTTARTSIFDQMAKALDRKIAGILKASAQSEDTDIDKKVKDFYASCTQFSKLNINITEITKEKLIEIINEFGGMPALRGTHWNADSFDWIETVAKIAHKYDKGIILRADIMPDFSQNTLNRVYIKYPEFPLLSRSMYVNNSTLNWRLMYKTRISIKLQKYLEMEPESASRTSSEIVDFETALALGMVDENKALELGELSERTLVSILQKKYAPNLDVDKLIRISIGKQVLVPIYEYAPNYQANLIEVISETPKSTIANYIIYTLIENFFFNDTPGAHEKNCIRETKEYFAKILDNMVYRHYNTKKLEHEVKLVWNELKRSLKTELHSKRLHWITESVRDLSIEKLDAMDFELNTYENVNFTEEFGELDITRDDFITNIKNIYELNGRRKVKMFDEKAQPLEDGVAFSFSPVNVVEANTVKLPVALLQPYYLWAEYYPSALKYGCLGAIMAHELLHGFDDSGRKYNKWGNQDDWWDESSIKAFKNRTECFIDQYSNFSYTAGKLPRSELQSENIADNGGVRIAYQSYLRWLQYANDDEEELETLPTMKYTNKQLFFISYAQLWCDDIPTLIRNLQVNTDTHMPGKFRVVGPLSNFSEFAREFNCANDTVMNPSKKCEIY